MEPTPTTGPEAERLARQAVEDARWAPSVLNAQPWSFSLSGARISLREDPERRMPVADPEGRETLIGCGAALLTLRVAVRWLGHEPEVAVLPDPDRPGLLADVTLGRPLPPGEDTARLHAQIRRRRTHRGGFLAGPRSPGLVDRLRAEARLEGATLRVVADSHTREALAGLTRAAEHVQRLDPRYVAEAARWAPAPGSRRADGVHEGDYPRDPAPVEPDFAGRDFARGHGWGAGSGGRGTEPGTVAILTTEGDGRADRLRAGQALQRVLLRAAEEDLSAAFHTQVLEVPELREFVRVRFCGGHHPQMLLRLGRADGEPGGGVRRPTAEIVTPEP